MAGRPGAAGGPGASGDHNAPTVKVC